MGSVGGREKGKRVSTLLEIDSTGIDWMVCRIALVSDVFQPFLRFYLQDVGLEIRPVAAPAVSTLLEILPLVWWVVVVFKFFFGFLSSRRSV